MFKFSFSLALWFAEDSYQFFGGEREIGQFTKKIELLFSTIIIFIFDLKKIIAQPIAQQNKSTTTS